MDGAMMKAETFDSVWDALADSVQEAEELKARSTALYELRKVVSRWELPPDEAATRLGITVPRLDELLGGKLSTFSHDDLLEIASAAELPGALAIKGAA